MGGWVGGGPEQRVPAEGGTGPSGCMPASRTPRQKATVRACRPAGHQHHSSEHLQGAQPQAHEGTQGKKGQVLGLAHVGTPAWQAFFSRSRQPPCILMEAPARASMPFLMPLRMPAGDPGVWRRRCALKCGAAACRHAHFDAARDACLVGSKRWEAGQGTRRRCQQGSRSIPATAITTLLSP